MAIVEDIGKIISKISPHYAKRKPAEEHKLVYDSSSETLEPVYFWIVDMMNARFGGKVEKIVDNFGSTPGSGHFSELGQRASIMQQQAGKILGDINIVIKSIMNILWDLKEFEIRLKEYNLRKSKDKIEAEAGLLALKQIWLDNVDIKRGRGAIHAMAQDLQMVTIRDAFMVASSLDDIDKMDLNDRIKRILKPRLAEFLEWIEMSEKELRKRFEIEKTYLKSQLASVQLYTRWVKPYIRAAAQLEQKDFGRNPAMVSTFNTIVLELALFGKREIGKDEIQEDVLHHALPPGFEKINWKKKFYSCVLVDFRFRGIPQRVGQQAHYAFGGRVEVTFRAYGLTEQELKKVEEELKKSDLNDALSLGEAITSESLEQIKGDIEYFLGSNPFKEPQKPKITNKNDVNPFLALFGFYDKSEKKEEKKEEKIVITSDNYYEELLRKKAEGSAADICFGVYDVYKKAHGMASHPNAKEW